MNSSVSRARSAESHALRPFQIVAAVLATLLVLGTLLGTQSAGAVQPGSHNGKLVTSTSPSSWTPNVLDGYVSSFAEVGDTMLVGGNFSQIAASNDPTPINRPYVFSFQKNSGTLNTSFAPVVNGEVTSVLSAGDGLTAWIAGSFNTLNGQTVRNIAKVDLATGQRITQFAAPAFNGQINDIRLRNGKLYVFGRFTLVGNQTRTLIAALDPVTGALDADVRADFTEPRKSSFLTIGTADVTADGTRAIVAGNFTKVNGLGRYQIAMLDLTTSPISVVDWSTNQYGDGCSNSFATYMRDVDFSPDGSNFVVATTGAYNTTFLCDAAARWETAATGSSLLPTWVNYSGGDTLTAVAVTDTAVYIGGHQRWMNNPYAADRIGAGAVARDGLAAVDPRSGATLSWNPGRDRGVAVYGLLATNSGLWIGSDTERIANEQYRARLAFMPIDNSKQMPTEFTGTLPAQVVSLGLMQGGFGSTLDRTTSRTLTDTGVTGTSTTATGGSQWRDLRGAFMIDGNLYTGWSNDTFRVQSFDGTTFGPQTTIPLRLITTTNSSTNRFATEDLASITGMFYDKASGRIYFTKSGSSSLHYRSFSPESNIVGAARISSSSNAGGVSWSSVQSMFMVDGKLYTSSTSGNLTRYDWNSATGLPTGSPVTVSGPAIDGEDWRARDAFVFAQGGVVAPNVAPTAAFTSACTNGSCQFDGSTSVDPDGSITSYVWDFGDGTSPGTGVNANHVYTASGTYQVTLTVTDNRGATATVTIPRDVVVPNVPPVATFDPNCTGLDCSFDGAASSDADGTIVSYDWTFGDGATATGATPTHSYSAAGPYTVSLTVTDNTGGTNTKTTGISVVDPDATPTVVFRAAAGTNVNATSATVTVPASVKAGDVMVLISSAALDTATLTGPAGWTLLNSATNSTATARTAAWTKVATVSDPGTAVRVNSSVQVKASLQLLAYEGADSISAHAVAIDTVSRTDRTTPTVPVASPGSALISYWADKSNDNVGWDLPGGVTLRNESVGSGNGRITAAVADTTPVDAGTAGGLTAIADSANRRGIVWSIVLDPSTAAPNNIPTASFTSQCTGLACTFDATASSDSDGTITGYAWTFGDGSTATGATPSRTYSAAGTYPVTLTVTDDLGATNATSRSVTVAPPAAANVTFRAAAGSNVNALAAAVTVPATVQAGDVMVLISTVNNQTTNVTGPAGWTLVNSGTSAATDTKSFLWSKTATATDAGTAVSMTNSIISKTALQLSAYSGASGITAQSLIFDNVNHAARTTPIVPVASANSLLVSYWADKSAATTTWSMPAAAVLRNLSVGTGSGRITAAIADTGSLAAGVAGGLTATSDSSNARGVTWSVVIGPTV